ncbi:HD domain-containing protein [Patescibacteria group bacterium]
MPAPEEEPIQGQSSGRELPLSPINLDPAYLEAKWSEIGEDNPIFRWDTEFEQMVQEHIDDGSWTVSDIQEIRLASWVMMEAMENENTRENGDPEAAHSFEVALVTNGICDQTGITNKESAFLTKVALIHDVKEIKNSEKITSNWLIYLFDTRTAKAVTSLTKAKTSKSADMPDKIHHSIHELIDTDPTVILVKLADRQRMMETIFPLNPNKRSLKARETLDVYVPLAQALGLHSLANMLANLSINTFALTRRKNMLELRRRDKDYQQVYDTTSDILGQLNPHGLTDSEVRPPTIHDAYKLAGGEVSRIKAVNVPVFVTLAFNSESGSDNHTQNGWTGQILAYAKQLVDKDLLTEEAYLDLARQTLSSNGSIDVVSKIGKVSVRFRFLRQDENLLWKTSVFDINSEDEVVRGYAQQKLETLQTTFQTIKDAKWNLRGSVREFSECLKKGIVVVKDNLGNEHGLVKGATVLDAAYYFHTEIVGRFAQNAVRTENDDGRELELDSPLESGMQLAFGLDKNNQVKPDWLDIVKTGYAKEKIQRELRKLISLELTNGESSSEDSILVQVQERGIEVIERIFLMIVSERRLSESKLLLHINEAEEIYRNLKPKWDKLSSDKKENQTLNFIMAVGLDEVVADVARTSLVWQTAERLVAIQKGLLTIEINLLDRPKTLQRVIRLVSASGINIKNISQSPDQPKADYQKIIIKISPESLPIYLTSVKKKLDELADAKIVGRVFFPSFVAPAIDIVFPKRSNKVISALVHPSED